jgi:hypothetical protein
MLEKDSSAAPSSQAAMKAIAIRDKPGRIR